MSKLKKIEGGKKEKQELWHVTVKKINGEIREFEDVIRIEPTATGLLAITSLSSKTVVIPFDRIDEYSLKPISEEE